MFDTLKYAKVLESVGFSRAQAEVQVQMISDVMSATLASKQDLNDLGGSFRTELTAVREELKADINGVHQELRLEIKDVRSEIRELEYRLTIKLGTIVSVAIGIAVALTKLI